VAALATALLALLAWHSPTSARTILLNAGDCDRAAGISEAAPRLSWALRRDHGVINTGGVLLQPGDGLLLSFALEKIPEGQRIVHAELIVPVTRTAGPEPRFYLWRILHDWGAGVCYRYRFAGQERVPWTRPGARGISSDRATRPTDVVRVEQPGETAINVTEDVELWHSGSSPNYGWLLTVEDPEVRVDMHSPIWDNPAAWTLRITYEPEQ
jgi:hypothetical protein